MRDPVEGDVNIDAAIHKLTEIYNEAVEAENRARAFVQHTRNALIEAKLRKLGIVLGQTVVRNSKRSILVERVGSPTSMALYGRRVWPCGTLGNFECRVGPKYTVVGPYEPPALEEKADEFTKRLIEERERNECLEEV